MAKTVQISVAKHIFNAGDDLFMICDDNITVQTEGRSMETVHFLCVNECRATAKASRVNMRDQAY